MSCQIFFFLFNFLRSFFSLFPFSSTVVLALFYIFYFVVFFFSIFFLFYDLSACNTSFKFDLDKKKTEKKKTCLSQSLVIENNSSVSFVEIELYASLSFGRIDDQKFENFVTVNFRLCH